MHSNDKDTQLIWERYVAEGLGALFGNSSPQNISQVTTYGELNQLVSGIIQSAKTGEQARQLGGFALDQILGVIPGAGNVASAFDLFKALYFFTFNNLTQTHMIYENLNKKHTIDSLLPHVCKPTLKRQRYRKTFIYNESDFCIKNW